MTTAPTRKYNPGFLTDDELVASFCVRTHEFESLIESLSACTGDSNQHQIVLGPRGSGKTSLLLRVAAEVRRDTDLAAGFFPIVFAEESYEVSTAGEFWLECLARLAIQAPEREDAPNLHGTLADLRAIQDDRTLGERCLAVLLDFADRESKRLVLMVENLNMMFRDMMDRDAGWRLRKILQNEPRIILLASATSRFDEIDHPDHALYDLFRVLTLRPLNTTECAALWETVAGQSRPTKTIRSLEILTGGSPRLLAIVARFGAGLSFRELMDSLFDLVDDHTEYFKSHLESLPAQERRVYLALADIWKPALTKEVAERARLETSKCSAQLARLIERGVVRLDGGSARRKQYYLSERMYNIYYLLRRGQEHLVEVLVRFMEAYYSPAEIKDISARISREAEGVVPEMQRLYQYTSAKLMEMSGQPHQGEDERASKLGFSADTQAMSALLERGLTLLKRNRNEDALATLDELLCLFGETQMPALLVGVANALLRKGVALGALNRRDEALAAYDEVLRRFSDSDLPKLLEPVAKALFNKGVVLGEMRRRYEALAAYDEVLRRFGDQDAPELVGPAAKALVNKGVVLGAMNRQDEALAVCDEVLRRFSDSDAPELIGSVAKALVNKSAALHALYRRSEALAACDEVLRRFSESDALELLGSVANALVNKSAALHALYRRKEALAACDEVLCRFGESDALELLQPVAMALVKRGVTLGTLRRPEKELAVYDEVVCRFGESGTPELSKHAADALVRKSVVLAKLSRPAQPRDITVLLAILPKLDSPESAIRALMRFSIDHSPERMHELIQASPAAELLRPLTTALEREMGLSTRVPEEISEVAEDIQRDLAEMRKARRS